MPLVAKTGSLLKTVEFRNVCACVNTIFYTKGIKRMKENLN